MENEVSDSIRIAVELIITALLLTMIVLFGFVSNRAVDDKARADSAAEYMNEITDLYWYDDRVVTASDAMELMMTYPGQYNYYFEYRGPDGTAFDERSREIEKQSDTGDVREYWSESSLREMIDGFEKSSFTSTLIRNPDGQSVGGILFVYQEG